MIKKDLLNSLHIKYRLMENLNLKILRLQIFHSKKWDKINKYTRFEIEDKNSSIIFFLVLIIIPLNFALFVVHLNFF